MTIENMRELTSTLRQYTCSNNYAMVHTHTIAILSIPTSIIYFYIQLNPIFPFSQRKIIKFHSQHPSTPALPAPPNVQ